MVGVDGEGGVDVGAQHELCVVEIDEQLLRAISQVKLAS